MMENENNWLYCQIKAIVRYACGPAGQEHDVGALRALSLRLQQASAHIECEIKQRIDAGKTAAKGRWS